MNKRKEKFRRHQTPRETGTMTGRLHVARNGAGYLVDPATDKAVERGVLDKAQELVDRLKAAGIRVKLDDRDTVTPGWKFNEWELKGVPVRIEMGPRDIENGVATVVRRDTFEKTTIALDNLVDGIKALLDDIQKNMYKIADEFRMAHTKVVHTYDELKEQVDGGYAKAMWCGDTECEDKIKNDTNGVKSRCIPFHEDHISDVCVCCGKPAKHMVVWGRQY